MFQAINFLYHKKFSNDNVINILNNVLKMEIKAKNNLNNLKSLVFIDGRFFNNFISKINRREKFSGPS